MYRQGPEGTPFHTLLVEGYVDGPLDVCESHWNDQNILISIILLFTCVVINFNIYNLMTCILYYRFVYLVGDNPVQEMVRIGLWFEVILVNEKNCFLLECLRVLERL